jgi:hypothetical protein
MSESKLFTWTFALSILAGHMSPAQTFDVPELEIHDKKDYAKYNQNIIACVNWLENTPLDQEPEKRTEANAFLIKWLSGTPDVAVSLNSEIVTKYTDKNPQLLVLFLGGWSRYALQNNYSKDELKGYYAGFKTMILVYRKGVAIKKEKALEHLVKVYDEGKLEDWIKDNIKFN